MLATTLIWGGTAHAQDISRVDITSDSQKNVRIDITFTGKAPKPSTVFAINDDNPRLVMDWNDASFQLSHKDNTIDGQGIVKSVRYARRGNGTRLVIDLKQKNLKPIERQNGRLMTFTFGSPSTSDAPKAVKTVKANELDPRYFAKTTVPYPILKPKSVGVASRPYRRPVIVIDPGHGGRDPGAIGQKGTKEKVITWTAAQELQRQLLATGRYDVIMTRSKDVYVEHKERIRIARAGGADLFISIHADSAGPNARGATVYTLADRAKTRSKRIVNTQNWIMDVDLTEQTDPVGDILVDLAQRSTKSNSTQFADILIGELAGSTRLINNSHRRAGYFVLLAPDVPAVLLELGFLSHPSDEKLLNKSSHRKKVLKSVTSAINLYFDAQSP
ncbi:N-acetylmuramoyl-L-alanine amidase [Fretibacter rubidus]|uniref:N-acetylmuramoyl-L-alanine amidase n=1 Tax=Fretibacter rubidus TaxID=570162 RepID=UPI00352A3D87